MIASPFIADNQARIKRIIFLELWEVPKIQRTPKLCRCFLFLSYSSGYILRKFFIAEPLLRLALNGTVHNNNENSTFTLIIVHLSLRSCLCSARVLPLEKSDIYFFLCIYQYHLLQIKILLHIMAIYFFY